MDNRTVSNTNNENNEYDSDDYVNVDYTPTPQPSPPPVAQNDTAEAMQIQEEKAIEAITNGAPEPTMTNVSIHLDLPPASSEETVSKKESAGCAGGCFSFFYKKAADICGALQDFLKPRDTSANNKISKTN